MDANTNPTRLSDDTLLVQVKEAAADERGATVRLITLLGELDARRLYLGEGCSSLFTYCTQVLHLSEHAAYGRIEAARAARTYPAILDLLADGSLTLTAIGLLRPHLTDANHKEVLDAARHKNKREVEQLVAGLRPQPAVASMVRRLPSVAPSPQLLPAVSNGQGVAAKSPESGAVPSTRVELPPSKPSVVKPLAPERYKIQFTISAETHAKLREVQDLLRHQVPNGDPAEIFDRALTVLREQLQRTKLATAARPRVRERSSAPASRHIPAAVKREVWARDGGRCAFVGAQGRCTETGFLEYHHVEPYAAGGHATTDNIQLRCRAHNLYEADLFFGESRSLTVREAGVGYYWHELGPGPSS